MSRRTQVVALLLSSTLIFTIAFMNCGGPQFVAVQTLQRSRVFEVVDDMIKARNGRPVAARIDKGNRFAGSSSRVTKTYVVNGTQESVLADFTELFAQYEIIIVTNTYVSANNGDEYYRAETPPGVPEDSNGLVVGPGEVAISVSATSRTA